MNANASTNLADAYLAAFPAHEGEVVLQHADSTARSSFAVCRICGSLVLASMKATHAVENHTN